MKNLLKDLFLFKGLDYDELDGKYSVSRKIKTIEYEDGSQVLTSSDGDKGIFILIKGKAKIVSVSKKHDAPLRFLSEGDTFGAASLYGSEITHRTRVISEGQMTALIIPRELTDELIEKESRVALNYIGFLSDRVSFLNRKIAAFSAGSADEKLALYLLSLPFDSGVCTLSDSYTDIAKALDVGRASLYRSIENFEKAGIIKRDGKIIRLTDKDKLNGMIG